MDLSSLQLIVDDFTPPQSLPAPGANLQTESFACQFPNPCFQSDRQTTHLTPSIRTFEVYDESQMCEDPISCSLFLENVETHSKYFATYSGLNEALSEISGPPGQPTWSDLVTSDDDPAPGLLELLTLLSDFIPTERVFFERHQFQKQKQQSELSSDETTTQSLPSSTSSDPSVSMDCSTTSDSFPLPLGCDLRVPEELPMRPPVIVLNEDHSVAAVRFWSIVEESDAQSWFEDQFVPRRAVCEKVCVGYRVENGGIRVQEWSCRIAWQNKGVLETPSEIQSEEM